MPLPHAEAAACRHRLHDGADQVTDADWLFLQREPTEIGLHEIIDVVDQSPQLPHTQVRGVDTLALLRHEWANALLTEQV